MADKKPRCPMTDQPNAAEVMTDCEHVFDDTHRCSKCGCPGDMLLLVRKLEMLAAHAQVRELSRWRAQELAHHRANDLAKIAELGAELERERVRLAGCGAAALGYGEQLDRDSFGWWFDFN